MISDILLMLIAVIALIFAAIVDIKIKEVPNWITYSLITSALAIRLIASLAVNEFYYFLYALIALAITFIIGNILYYTQMWGGGDSKLLIALAVVFATHPYFIQIKYPFLFVLSVNILLAGAVYGFVYALVLAIRHRKQFINEFKKLNQNKRVRLMKIISLLLGIILLISIFVAQHQIIKIILAGSAILIIFYINLWVAIKSVENACMYAKMPVANLVEGDWIAEDIKIDSKIIYKKQKTGISKKEIENLKKNNISHVTIKQGIPFVPPFLIGLILTLLISL